jgi:hypothetical protein
MQFNKMRSIRLLMLWPPKRWQVQIKMDRSPFSLEKKFALIVLSLWLVVNLFPLVQQLLVSGDLHLCLFHWITGHNCPGCGMTRAFLAIGEGDLLMAISYNPFSLGIFILLLYQLSPIKVTLKSRRQTLIFNKILFVGIAFWWIHTRVL